jgi:hypothetical protein
MGVDRGYAIIAASEVLFALLVPHRTAALPLLSAPYPPPHPPPASNPSAPPPSHPRPLHPHPPTPTPTPLTPDRVQKLKDARTEAAKEIEEYKAQKDAEFKKFESEVGPGRT